MAGSSGDSHDDPAPADVVADPFSAVDPPVHDPVVVVIDEGSVAPVAGVPPSVADGGLVSGIVLDDRFYQLDELATQDSQSILPHCVEN